MERHHLDTLCVRHTHERLMGSWGTLTWLVGFMLLGEKEEKVTAE